MNASEIVTAFGAYYEKSPANKDRILGKLSQGIVTPKYCTPIITDDTVYKLSELIVGDLVQGFQKAWTPKDDIKFTPNELRLFHMKVDIDLFPDDLQATWLGFLATGKVDKKDEPLIRFILEHPNQGILAKINSNMELKEYGKGIYTDVTPGTAGITGKSMNGFIYQIQNGVDDETMNSLNISALNKDTIFDQVELFTEGIADEYQDVEMNVFMSSKWYRHYHKDKRSQGFYQMSSDADVKDNIDFTPQNVVALPCLSGTDVIFATPKANMLHLTKNLNNKSSIKIEERQRTVSLMADWWEGLGFGINGIVWTNLQKTP
ncbi:MAG: hypothetical protein NTZ33_06210 [Bacteroidetes bacterium]|nr:hypothetical protein [Bacteroidota bacterium]